MRNQSVLPPYTVGELVNCWMQVIVGWISRAQCSSTNICYHCWSLVTVLLLTTILFTYSNHEVWVQCQYKFWKLKSVLSTEFYVLRFPLWRCPLTQNLLNKKPFWMYNLLNKNLQNRKPGMPVFLAPTPLRGIFHIFSHSISSLTSLAMSWVPTGAILFYTSYILTQNTCFVQQGAVVHDTIVSYFFSRSAHHFDLSDVSSDRGSSTCSPGF